MATSLGSVTGQVYPLGSTGYVSFIGAGGGAVTVRDGDGSGKVLAVLAANENVVFEHPVRFKNGLNLSATAVIHVK